ncbi:MAG: FUN14 domain-containing protein [Candidatus Nitrosopolaris sp.]
MFIAAIAYLEYQRIISVDWEALQTASQNAITTFANTLTNISDNIGTDHTGVTTNLALTNLGIPLASGASAGFALGFGTRLMNFQRLFVSQDNVSIPTVRVFDTHLSVCVSKCSWVGHDIFRCFIPTAIELLYGIPTRM